MTWLAKQPRGDGREPLPILRSGAGIDGSRRKHATAYVESFNAADSHVISVAALVTANSSPRTRCNQIGCFASRLVYDALATFLSARFCAAGGTLLLAHPVRRVRGRKTQSRSAVSMPAARISSCMQNAPSWHPAARGAAGRTVKFEPAPRGYGRMLRASANGSGCPNQPAV